MTPILSKFCKALRNTWNYTGSQSLKAETRKTADFFMPVNSMQNDVVWGGFRRHSSRPCCNIFLIFYNFLLNRILMGYPLSSWLQLFLHFKLLTTYSLFTGNIQCVDSKLFSATQQIKRIRNLVCQLLRHYSIFIMI